MEIDPYLVGVLKGDGWTYDRGKGSYVTAIDQAEKNKKIIIAEVVPRLRRMGFTKVKPYRFFAKHDGIYKWRASVYSKALHLELKKIFANIISYIRRLTIEDAKQFIAGFMDAEGTLNGKKIIIYNQDIEILRAMWNKLRKMGIEPTNIYRYNVVHGLTFIRKADVKKLLAKIPARKFKMRSYRAVTKWASGE